MSLELTQQGCGCPETEGRVSSPNSGFGSGVVANVIVHNTPILKPICVGILKAFTSSIIQGSSEVSFYNDYLPILRVWYKVRKNGKWNGMDKRGKEL